MMFSGNGYTKATVSWEKWERKGCPGEDARVTKAPTKRQDMCHRVLEVPGLLRLLRWIFERFARRNDNGSRKENKLQLQENLIKTQRNANNLRMDGGGGGIECV